MAVESKRGCGYRKVGGLYLVSGQLSAPCGRLPLELHVCPTCNAGIKQTRGWQWVKPGPLLANAPPCGSGFERTVDGGRACPGCALSPRFLATLETAGLLWVGGAFYPEAVDFMREAATLGVSRRIPAVPRGFKLGEHWVLIAHPKAVSRLVAYSEATPEEQEAWSQVPDQPIGPKETITVTRKGIVTAFKPTAIEKIVTATQAQDTDAMDELTKKGITPVVVPDNDPDHQGSVYDKDDDEPQLPFGNGHGAEAAAP
jgi:hypothetical protein